MERHDNVFTAWVSKNDAAFQPVGGVHIALSDTAWVGIAAGSENAEASENTGVANVQLEQQVLPAGQKRIRETFLERLVVATGERKVAYRDYSRFEAPIGPGMGRLSTSTETG